jgi:PIN domain nuclease of toxin-antitoxin system
MAAVVADTHAVLWMLTNSVKLSQAARTALEEAVMTGEPIYVASISVVEVVYLVDKNRLPKLALERLIDALRNPTSGLAIVALNQDIAEAMTQIPIKIVPDMPDRIIAATALYMKLPLVTRDHKIQAAPLTTIW